MTEPPYFSSCVIFSAQVEEVVIRTDIIQEEGKVEAEEESWIHIGLF